MYKETKNVLILGFSGLLGILMVVVTIVTLVGPSKSYKCTHDQLTLINKTVEKCLRDTHISSCTKHMRAIYCTEIKERKDDR